MSADRWALVDAGIPGAGGRIELDPGESRHLADILRLRAGDSVTLCDGRGRVAESVLTAVDSRRCELEVVAPQDLGEQPGPSVAVALSALHSQAMDWAVQKCVEVGVATLIPLLSERSQLGAKAAAGRLDHWRRVAWQALKQCRRPWRMEVAQPTALAQIVGGLGRGPGLVADPNGMAMDQLDQPLPSLVVVGPEGGLSAGELGLLGAAGWPGVRLGRWVLRAETAAVVGAAALIAAHERQASV
jgi:16S rRNA (uracil1498-N3)-methyltransferase